MKFVLPLLFALGLTGAAMSPAMAQSGDTAPVDDLVMSSEGFLSYHPDLRHRLVALGDYRAKRYSEALVGFQRAARFADKPSQGMIAEMLWNGQGAAVDRPLAYVWMDLAAERGYKMMLVKRENFWNAMSETERTRALELGDALFLEYADKYAKPRMEARLRKARMKMTGSRTGFVGTLQIEIPTPNGSRTINGSSYYQDEFWKADQYWRMQDSDWKDFGEGTVEIGELQSVGDFTVPEDTSEGDGEDSDPR